MLGKAAHIALSEVFLQKRREIDPQAFFSRGFVGFKEIRMTWHQREMRLHSHAR